MIAMFSFCVTMKVSCSLCVNVVTVLDEPVPRYNRVPEPGLPHGWRAIDNLIVCPGHSVTIRNKKGRQKVIKR